VGAGEERLTASKFANGQASLPAVDVQLLRRERHAACLCDGHKLAYAIDS
jgi:hypothetical protein